MSSSTSDAIESITYHYAEQHILQTVSVSLNPQTTSADSDTGYWAIYIHGGAWRDPTITSASFNPTRSILLHTSLSQKISAFASIEYRLSPHPNFPQDPHTTPSTELRCATHPDHILDVRSALAFLQTKYGFRDRYILIGHSCGATLAFQSVMGSLPIHLGADADADAATIINPKAIVGVEGIYDLRLLRDTHREYSAYEEFLTGAFGADEDVWDVVSPARASGTGSWGEGKLAVLAHSVDDELVDFAQVDAMSERLKAWKEEEEEEGRERRVVVLRDLHGLHDEVWSKGEELARVISVAVEELVRLDGRS